MAQKVGIVQFPGTNCDRDVEQAVRAVNKEPVYLWYKDHHDLESVGGLVIPGGFSYGDYLRPGALAARSRVMEVATQAAKKGLPVLGICNGFQVLCESGLLPGQLMLNLSGRFVDDWASLLVVQGQTPWSQHLRTGQEICLPVAHGDGRYYCPEGDLKKMEDREQIWLRYKNNPNGSVNDIAGITNDNKNVVGLMPHPERAIFDWMGGSDGFGFFEGL